MLRKLIVQIMALSIIILFYWLGQKLVGYHEITFKNINFYYKADSQLEYIDSITLRIEEYKGLAGRFFGSELFDEGVRAYLKDAPNAAKDANLAGGRNGYYDGSIILRTEPFEELGPSGKTSIFYSPNPVKTFYHEYTHHLMRQISDDKFPAWFEEGLAEYLSGLTLKEKPDSFKLLEHNILEDESSWSKYPSFQIYTSSEIYVKKMIAIWGDHKLRAIIHDVSIGEDFHSSLEKNIGLSYKDAIQKLESVEVY